MHCTLVMSAPYTLHSLYLARTWKGGGRAFRIRFATLGRGTGSTGSFCQYSTLHCMAYIRLVSSSPELFWRKSSPFVSAFVDPQAVCQYSTLHGDLRRKRSMFHAN